jgi:hypothetical protein
MIRGSPRLVSILPRAAPVIASLVPPVAPTPVAPVDPNYTTYETSLVFQTGFTDGRMIRDASGNFYGRLSNQKYYKFSPTGVSTFLAGDGNLDYGVFTPGLGAAARFGGNGGVKDIVLDSSGNLFTVHEQTHRIIKIEPNGNVTSFAGTGSAGTGDGPAATAAFYYPIGIAIDASNTLYVSESSRRTIRKITSSGQVSTLTFSSVFTPSFKNLAVDSSGVIYALDVSLHRVYKIIPTGPTTADIALLAGSTQGYANGQGSAAQFFFQYQNGGIAVDTFGNVYIGDYGNGSVRKISPSGNVITIAGNGIIGSPDSNTQLAYPAAVFVDINGVVYVSTQTSIRKISPLIANFANAGGIDGFVVKYNSEGTPQWARRLGGTGSIDIPLGSSTDSSGNIIVVGYYNSNPLTIYNADGTTFTTLTNSGSDDGFVVKYNSEGTPQWARKLGGTNSDFANSVTTDSNGNIVVTGQYASNPLTLFAADGTTAFTTLTNSGLNDGFVVKYNSAGTPLWARRLGGTGTDIALGSSTDSSGNIIVAVQYTSNPLTIYNADGTTFTTLANDGANDGGNDGFVVKYNSEGTPQWARKLGGTGSIDIPLGSSTDSSGNIIVVGYYNSNPLTIYNADGTTFTTLACLGSFDGFVVKYDSTGTLLWARRVSGTSSELPLGSSTDSSGNIIVVGYYDSTTLTIYNANGTTFTTLANAGGNDGFVVKYDSSGTPLWARRVSGTSSELPFGSSTDSSGNIIVAGRYDSNPLTIYNANGTTFTTLANAGGNDVFVVKYNSDGTPLWAKRVGGTGSDTANSVTTDSAGNIIVGGYYASNPLTIT